MVSSKSIILAVALAAAAALTLFFLRADANPQAPTLDKGRSARPVSCLGRLVPGEKVIHLAGPYAMQGPSIVKELFVRRGDRVSKGAIVAKLQSFDTVEAQLRQAEAEVEVLARMLEQVKAGEKASSIAAQEAIVLRGEAELKNATAVLRRDRELFLEKTISVNDFERSELAWRVAQKNYDEATNHLESLKEVRKVDVNVAEARLKAAAQTVNRIKAELEQMTIRSPVDGTILEVRTYPGESLDKDPIVEIGELQHMNIEAEVYVTDIAQVRVGASARAKGDGFRGELSGVVSEVGLQVDSSSIFNPDPASFSDKRVVKVRIKLEDGERVRGLVNHQVNVVISP